MVKQLMALLEYPLVFAAIFITGIGGTFNLGFHLSVMTSPSLFIKKLVNRTSTERYGVSLEEWQVDLIWSILISVLCVGGLLGSLLAVQMGKKYGRKQCLLLNNVGAILASVLMILSERAVSFEMIMVARLLFGINAGISMTVHPIYLMECTPKHLRGIVGVTTATFVSTGKFIGQLLGIKELLGTEERWMWLLGFSGFLALLQLSTLHLLPESPRYLLLNRGDQQGYDRAVKRLWGSRDHSLDMQEMLREKMALQNMTIHTIKELLLSRSLRWVVLTIVVLFMEIQLSGMNAVYFYSSNIFAAAGIPSHQRNYVSFGMGLCEVIASFGCAVAIGSIGRKTLLVCGYTGLAVTHILLTVTLSLQDSYSWVPYCSIALVFLSVFFVSSGPSGVTLTLLAEVFTQSYKPAGVQLACSISWIGLLLVGMVFPILVEYLESFCFLMFLFFTVITIIFVWFNVPEMNNLSALEIQEEFRKMHTKTTKAQGGRPTANGTPATDMHNPSCQTKL